uniref:Uncharacterized protein n=1 Tax=Arundo donax TaxID=35708 RepID=A0A0A9C5S2_ARUDO
MNNVCVNLILHVPSRKIQVILHYPVLYSSFLFKDALHGRLLGL